MARNYKELQEKMDPVSRAENAGRVRAELQRMAKDELRNAKRLTQAEPSAIFLRQRSGWVALCEKPVEAIL
jgi:hypothetical protein